MTTKYRVTFTLDEMDLVPEKELVKAIKDYLKTSIDIEQEDRFRYQKPDNISVIKYEELAE